MNIVIALLILISLSLPIFFVISTIYHYLCLLKKVENMLIILLEEFNKKGDE